MALAVATPAPVPVMRVPASFAVACAWAALSAACAGPDTDASRVDTMRSAPSHDAALVAPAPIALVGVHVVDVVGGTILRDRTVVVMNGRITQVAPRADARIPVGATGHDFAGAYVIPGLWDMHVHVASVGRTAFPLFLANGVTGVRDMGSRRAIVGAWIDSVDAGLLEGPRVATAATIVESAGWLQAVRDIASNDGDSALVGDLAARLPFAAAESASRVVDSVIALGGTFLKIRNDPSPPALFALLRAARAKGLPVTGHWPTRVSADVASDSGFRGFEHGPLSVHDGALVASFGAMSPAERRALYERFARNGTAYTPTTVALRGYRLTPDSAVSRELAGADSAVDVRMRFMDPELVRRWRGQVALKSHEGATLPWGKLQAGWLGELRAMADAGVPILAGTDAGVTLVHTGFALPDELEALVQEGGLTPLQSLRSATITPARWFGTEARQGSVAVGRDADLVVLDRDPLADIANVRRIRAVVRNGRVFDRFALDSLLDVVERRVRGDG